MYHVYALFLPQLRRLQARHCRHHLSNWRHRWVHLAGMLPVVPTSDYGVARVEFRHWRLPSSSRPWKGSPASILLSLSFYPNLTTHPNLTEQKTKGKGWVAYRVVGFLAEPVLFLLLFFLFFPSRALFLVQLTLSLVTSLSLSSLAGECQCLFLCFLSWRHTAENGQCVLGLITISISSEQCHVCTVLAAPSSVILQSKI